jgi:ribosomal protein L6P/L9E
MLRNIKKIHFNLEKYNNFLFFSVKEKKLFIKGFFGKIHLKIPHTTVLKIKNNVLIMYFYDRNLYILKTFNNLIIFSINNILLNYYKNIFIKGIGYKFILKENNLEVYNGNFLPERFHIPKSITVLNKNSLNSLNLLSNDYTLLNNFIKNIQKVAMPNKYKEIGIFIKNSSVLK